ncbi:MAG: glycosyltransferase [bacterium]|nr:glycosyltransferase [bacterium]
MKDKSVLFIAYDSLTKPILQSQGLPHLRMLCRNGFRCGLVTFETKAPDRLEAEKLLGPVRWYPVRQRLLRLKPQSLWDILQGVFRVFFILLKDRYAILHCRSHIAEAIGLVNSLLLRKKNIFDMRGLYPDEYVLSGYIRKRSFLYKLYKSLEYVEVKLCSRVVVVSERFRKYINLLYLHDRPGSGKIRVIPCAADLSRFRYNSPARRRIRTALNLEKRLVFVYSGSLAEWHLWRKSIDFFRVIRKRIRNAFFLFLTYEPSRPVEEYFKEKKVNSRDFRILNLRSEDVPSYLLAGDFGLMFIRPDISKQVCSPIKFGEYLACGLPVITNYGIGDTARYIGRYKTGLLYTMDELSRPGMINMKFMTESGKVKRLNGPAVARRFFDLRSAVRAYRRIYEELLS